MVISPLFFLKKAKGSNTDIVGHQFYIWHHNFLFLSFIIVLMKHEFTLYQTSSFWKVYLLSYIFLVYLNINIFCVKWQQTKTWYYIESRCITMIWVEHLFISPKVPLKMPELLYVLPATIVQKGEYIITFQLAYILWSFYVDLHKHLCLIMCHFIVPLLLT